VAVARPTFGSVALCAAAALAAVATALSLATGPARAGSASELSALESGVYQQINFIRTEHGLAPLKLNAHLGEAADEHSRQMAADGYFEHESADGTLFWKRIATFYPSGSSGYWSVGENLLWASPSVRSSAALQMWMHSPEHRANILDPHWREIGIAAVHAGRAPGVYGHRPITVITTDFGVRR
jgi:uncharacterized protein YkwD